MRPFESDDTNRRLDTFRLLACGVVHAVFVEAGPLELRNGQELDQREDCHVFMFFRCSVLVSKLERDHMFVLDSQSFRELDDVVNILLLHDVVESSVVALLAHVEVSYMAELVCEIGVADWNCIPGHVDNDWSVVLRSG